MRFLLFHILQRIVAGPTLGIGQECDGLGPMPIGGPKKKFICGGI